MGRGDMFRVFLIFPFSPLILYLGCFSDTGGLGIWVIKGIGYL